MLLPPGLAPALADMLETISLLIAAIGTLGVGVGFETVGFEVSVGIGRSVCGFVVGDVETGSGGGVDIGIVMGMD